MKNIKHFIWDFDGTLADSYPNLIRYMQQSLADFGKSADPVEILEKMMETVGHAIRWYDALYDLPQLSERFDYYHELGRNDPVCAFENVTEVLSRIQQMGAYNYIYTNRGETVDGMLDQMGLRSYFREIVKAGDPEFEFKPSPRSILYLMKKYGGTPEDTVMIGDRKCDLESGYQAGCKTIHLQTPSVLQYPPCDWRIRNFQEMLDALK